MILILALYPDSSPQVLRICGVNVVYKFVKCTTILGIDLEIDLRVNIFNACNK